MPKVDRVPAYKLHKSTGQARCIIRGRHHYLGPFGSPESKELYGRLIAELAVGKVPAAPGSGSTATSSTAFLVVELLARYWDFAQGYYVKNGIPSGWLTHIRLTLRLVREHYAHLPVAEFGPLCLKAIRQKLIDAGQSRMYINKLMPIVVRAFKWGVAEGIVPPHVYQGLRAVEGLKKGRTTAHETAGVLPVDDDVVDATLSYLPPVVDDMARFQRLTGCRPGEVCALRPCDLDRGGDVWAYRPAGHKTEHLGRERTVWIGPQAQEVLLSYLLRAPEAYCFSPAESEAKRLEAKHAARKLNREIEKTYGDLWIKAGANASCVSRIQNALKNKRFSSIGRRLSAVVLLMATTAPRSVNRATGHDAGPGGLPARPASAGGEPDGPIARWHATRRAPVGPGRSAGGPRRGGPSRRTVLPSALPRPDGCGSRFASPLFP